MNPEVGDIWYCTYNDAYFLIMDVTNNFITFRWLDTWEQDESEIKFFIQGGMFPYKKVA